MLLLENSLKKKSIDVIWINCLGLIDIRLFIHAKYQTLKFYLAPSLSSIFFSGSATGLHSVTEASGDCGGTPSTPTDHPVLMPRDLIWVKLLANFCHSASDTTNSILDYQRKCNCKALPSEGSRGMGKIGTLRRMNPFLMITQHAIYMSSCQSPRTWKHMKINSE